ncbi:Proteasome subunit beta type-1 [Porphyridium purpureum]|uniref:Proteasome subunit beta n=1 Tax=Porphyridium purpureum TaxID=35688 RepID=A0A5J4YTW3_PORPP|nr:Proteasome subunit beta type-1 [Porphyridium purpureum]|eukprot:POR4944..scf227_4
MDPLLRPGHNAPHLPAAMGPGYADVFDRLSRQGGRVETTGTNALPTFDAHAGAKQASFQPYQNNGGSVVAVAGKDFCVVASDTRFGLGFAVPTRMISRNLVLNDKVVLATAGMQADTCTLHKVLRIRLDMYRQNHGKDMSLGAVSQLLSNTLYYKRFFPYYTFNVLGGVDENGEGFCYGYDAIGSHEKVKVVCTGSSQSLIQPVLDNQVDGKQMYDGQPVAELSLEQTVELVKDCFSSAGERDIYTVGLDGRGQPPLYVKILKLAFVLTSHPLRSKYTRSHFIQGQSPAVRDSQTTTDTYFT